MAQNKAVAAPAVPTRQTFVQTERSAHVEWAKLAMKNKAAAGTMHQLVSLMDRAAAVAISYQTLADLLDCNERTIRRSIKYLKENNWLQVVQLGNRGTVNVYIINDRVAWAAKREDRHKLSRFSAVIVADASDQDQETLSPSDLRKVPVIHPPERALPSGEWPSGETGYLEGIEPVAVGHPEFPAADTQTDIEDFT